MPLIDLCVADIHVGYSAGHSGKFYQFLKEIHANNRPYLKVNSLIILGDFFDFWRHESIEVFLKNWKLVVSLITLPTQILFIIGNHDFHLITADVQPIINKIRTVLNLPPNFQVLEYGFYPTRNRQFFLMHGFHLEYPFMKLTYKVFNDLVKPQAKIINRFFSKLFKLVKEDPSVHYLEKKETAQDAIPNKLIAKTKRLPIPKVLTQRHSERLNQRKISRLRKEVHHLSQPNSGKLWNKYKSFVYGIPSQDFWQSDYMILYGHTHEHYIEERHANPGSWTGTKEKYLETRDNYLIIKNGSIKLERFTGKLKL
jgi:UDP-2,3-diacylglucosamine pyrophosphatase LpxH